jgi:hypothetical protein
MGTNQRLAKMHSFGVGVRCPLWSLWVRRIAVVFSELARGNANA